MEVHIFYRHAIMRPMQSSKFSFEGYRDTVENLLCGASQPWQTCRHGERFRKHSMSKLTSAGTRCLFDAANDVAMVLLMGRCTVQNEAAVGRVSLRAPAETPPTRHIVFTVSSKFLLFIRANGLVSGIVNEIWLVLF